MIRYVPDTDAGRPRTHEGGGLASVARSGGEPATAPPQAPAPAIAGGEQSAGRAGAVTEQRDARACTYPSPARDLPAEGERVTRWYTCQIGNYTTSLDATDEEAAAVEAAGQWWAWLAEVRERVIVVVSGPHGRYLVQVDP